MFTPTNLYYELPWLDIPMHILGGFGVGSLVVSFVTYRKQSFSLVPTLLVYLLVACVWELYEYTHDLLLASKWLGDAVDTFSDVINGAIGATIAYYILKK